jgi:hypothetical protein
LPRLIEHLLVKPLFDWPIAAGSALIVWAVGSGRKDGLYFGHLPAGTRSSIYVTVAGIAGALLGFFIATVAILLGLLDTERPRLKLSLAGGRAAQIQPVFFAAIRISAVAIPAMIILLVVDTKTYASGWMEATVVIVMVVASIRSARLIWLIRKLVLIATRDATEAGA